MAENDTIKSTVIIPNYNGITYIENCLKSLLEKNWDRRFKIIVVDNHSTDGSLEVIREKFPEVHLICNTENTGFCKAVNLGIEASDTEFVILLNNDTVVEEHFVSALEDMMEKYPKAFSVGAKMVDMKHPDILDDAGDFYCVLGWAFARGKGKSSEKYAKETEIFSACGGAVLYRKSVLEQIGLFDEEHFAYLEDLDIGYRAKLYGYKNYYTPDAVVYHAGSASSGSRYNEFKVSLSSKNSVYVIYKNMPFLQRVMNFPFFFAGYFIKWLFFTKKHLGKVYAKGVLEGIRRNCGKTAKEKKIRLGVKNFWQLFRIQLELFKNLFVRAFC